MCFEQKEKSIKSLLYNSLRKKLEDKKDQLASIKQKIRGYS